MRSHSQNPTMFYPYNHIGFLGKMKRISKFKKEVGCVVSHFTHLFVFQGKSAKLGCM